MVKIQQKSTKCKILNESNIDTILELDKLLSFKVEGSEYTAAGKGYFTDNGQYVKWDGIKKLLTPQLIFPTGLLEKVKDFYKSKNVEVEIIDLREPKIKNQPIDIITKLTSMGKSPYPYQLDIMNLTNTYDRGIIKVATGGGKSNISALITAHLNVPTIIHVIGKDLLYQFHKTYQELFDEEIGMVGDGICNIQRITIASIWTCGKALGLKGKDITIDSEEDENELSHDKDIEIKKMLMNAKLHMIDECHVSACDTIQTIYNNIQPDYLYGLSGSPWRDDGQDLLIESILGKYICNISASFLIKNGFLAQPIIRFKKVPPPEEELPNQYKTIYKNYIVENEIRNNLVVKSTQDTISKGYQTLVLFNSIKHGKILYDMFLEAGINCVLLDGKNSQEERDSVKRKALAGKIDCILASRIFDIGVDIPTLSGLILASAGKSSVRALQRVGRVIRKSKNKRYAAVVDFVDQVPMILKHSKARYKIYKSEEGFDVGLPTGINWR